MDLEELTKRLHPVFHRHRVSKAILFGSLARGQATRRSDLDLIVVRETTSRFLDRYDALLPEIVRAVPGCDVDLLIYTPAEFDQLSLRPFIARARREGKIIYESGQEPAPRSSVAADG